MTRTTSSSVIADGPLDDGQVGGSLLPAATYTDPALFDAERERIFAAEWAWAGFAHWVPEPGDVRPVSVAGRPLLLMRGQDGEIRVFHNACRHRGMQLTDVPLQGRRRLQCAYHCWTYELDGRLATTPFYTRQRGGSAPPELRERLGLLPVPSHTWGGMVLVHLGPEPTDVEMLLAPLEQRWEGMDFDRLHLAEERRFDIDANWKLVVENFLDYYHLPFIHPQVGSVDSTLDIDDVILSDRVLGGCYPHGAEAKAEKTDQSLPDFGALRDNLGGRQDIFCLFPNALLFLEADWYQVIAFEPVAPGTTVEHMAVFVDRSAADDAYLGSRKLLCDVLFQVNEQDLPVLRQLQLGRHSPAADQNHLVPYWDQVTARFQLTVRAALERDGDAR